MKKVIYTLLIIVVAFTSVIAQNRYMIYFKDKGQINKKSLSSVDQIEITAKKVLSKKSIERRKKLLGENYLAFEDLPLEESYLDVLRNNKIKIIHKLKWFNAVSAFLNRKEFEIVKSLSFVSKIEKVKQLKFERKLNRINKTGKLNKTASSNYIYNYGPSLTQNELSDIPAVHDMGITGEGVIIGLLDSGYDWETPNSLKDRNVLAEYDFVFNDNETANEAEDVSYQHNHGTSVFSILGGFNEGNIIGPAFNSQFLLAKTEYIPTETHVEEDNYAAALEWMDSIGVDITTSSLGYSEFDEGEFSYTYENMDGKTTIVTKAAEMAFDKGIVVITSAGNEGNSYGNDSTKWYYITAPGDGFNTVTIGAVTPSNKIASFSSRGPTYDGRIKPEIVAQGTSVYRALAGAAEAYAYGNGTSFSAPIAAGVAGLLLSAYPHLNNRQVRSILLESGDNVKTPNNDVGYGLVSALKAVTYPNIKNNNGNYILNKMFADYQNIDETSVKLVFEDGSNFSMTKNENNIYTAELTGLTVGENYKFYFTYKDLQNNEYREPIDNQYNFSFGDIFIDLFLTGIDHQKRIPSDYYLSQNYPNPFNPSTKIDYSIPNTVKNAHVELKLFNILGMEIKTFVNEIKKPGNYTIELNSGDLASGVYFYRLQVYSDNRESNFVQTKKMILLR